MTHMMRVKYDNLDSTTHDFVQLCGIYGLIKGYVYNTENDTYPKIEDIEKEMIRGRK